VAQISSANPPANHKRSPRGTTEFLTDLSRHQRNGIQRPPRRYCQ
jgi:hypothetical protein